MIVYRNDKVRENDLKWALRMIEEDLKEAGIVEAVSALGALLGVFGIVVFIIFAPVIFGGF